MKTFASNHSRFASLLYFSALMVCPQAMAAPPDALLYDGTLFLADGETPVDGPVTMTFALFDAANDDNQTWPEGEPEAANVQVTAGTFRVELGPLTPHLFDAPERRFLQVTVGDGDDAVAMVPRQPVGGAAFALMAHEAAVCREADVTSGLTPDGLASVAQSIGDDQGLTEALRGPSGRPGKDGADGEDGAPGAKGVGIANAAVNEAGELEIELTDDQTWCHTNFFDMVSHEFLRPQPGRYSGHLVWTLDPAVVFSVVFDDSDAET